MRGSVASWHHAPMTTRPAPDDQGPVSYWLREPGPPADPALVSGETLNVDVAIVGAGFTGLWTAIALTDTDPSLRIAVLEAETVAFGASGRNGGFCEASLTHGLANGIRHFPDELERLEREGIDNLDGLIAFTREHGIDCDLEETGNAVAGRPGVPGRGVPGLGRRGGRVRRAPRVPGPGCRPGRGPLPALAGRPVPAPRSGCRARPREALSWDRPSGPRARRPDRRADPGHETRARGRRGARADRRRGHGPRRARRGRHVRVLGLAPAPVPAVRARLRLRPGVGTAGCGSAGGHRLAAAPGPDRRQQPVPLLPADRGRSDPVGRLRRHPPLRQPGRARSWTSGRRRSTSSRRSSSAPSPSSKGSASRIAGAARSTRRRGSRSRSARRWAGA